ncbi:hypothetical protein STPYR_11676 [uncultured Stenotrophomonas sp.]|uniref:Uncharacterized protein n=1 Tax=uncultured Stenotrophomonas sp. TaxID=165438 RepID=A0A1Y5Q7A2_9GAMM|nr:hypothetical protein STPYR_11676 [uncultured Stenotrophomonas sp.]
MHEQAFAAFIRNPAKQAGKRTQHGYTGGAFSAVNDGVCKHSPCPLMTTTGARRYRVCRSALQREARWFPNVPT